MGFRFDIGSMDPAYSDSSSQPVHDLFSKGAPFEDIGAFTYYAAWGAADPKAPFVEVPATMRMFGIGFGAAYFRQLPYAMVGSGLLGWFVDPKDKREGGFWEYPEKPKSSDSYWDRTIDDPFSTW